MSLHLVLRRVYDRDCLFAATKVQYDILRCLRSQFTVFKVPLATSVALGSAFRRVILAIVVEGNLMALSSFEINVEQAFTKIPIVSSEQVLNLHALLHRVWHWRTAT